MSGDVSLYSDFNIIMQKNPVIASVNNLYDLDKAVASPCKAISILTGSIINIKDIVEKCRNKDKYVLVNLDLVEGLSVSEYALKYVNEYAKPDGIITTSAKLIKIARENNIFAVQRLFLLDTMSLYAGIKAIHAAMPEAIEILPGVLPKAIKRIFIKTRIPIIASGLITDKEEAYACLNAGATGVSTSNESVWYMSD